MSQHRIVFVFCRHPVDYSPVVVVILFFIPFVISLFILDYAHFTHGPPTAKDTTPANRFIFRGKNTKAVTAAGRARPASRFFDVLPLSEFPSPFSFPGFAF